MSKRDEAKNDYLNGMKYKDIASKYHVSINTVKSWKSRYWNKEQNPKLQKSKKVAHKSKKVAHKVATNNEQQIDNSSNVNEHGLNPQQEYYCLLRSNGYPKFNAYQVSYDESHKMARNTLQSAAYQLEKSPKVRHRIIELIENKAKTVRWDNDTAIEKMMTMFYEAMASVLTNGITKSNSDAVYNAFDRLNQLIGLDLLSDLKRKELQGRIKLMNTKIKNANGSDEQQMNQITKLLDDINGQLD